MVRFLVVILWLTGVLARAGAPPKGPRCGPKLSIKTDEAIAREIDAAARDLQSAANESARTGAVERLISTFRARTHVRRASRSHRELRERLWAAAFQAAPAERWPFLYALAALIDPA